MRTISALLLLSVSSLLIAETPRVAEMKERDQKLLEEAIATERFRLANKMGKMVYSPGFLNRSASQPYIANFSLATVLTHPTQPVSRPAATRPTAAPSALAMLTAAHVAGVTPAMALDDLVRLGIDALRDHSYETAIMIFEAIIREDRQNLVAMSGLAHAYDAQAESFASSSDPALSARAPALKTAAASWFQTLAATSFVLCDYKVAERSYLKVLSLEPSDYVSQFGLARAYMASGHFLNAIEQFNKCVRNPNTPPATRGKAYLELSGVYRRIGLKAQALDALNQAKELKQ